MPGGRFTDYFIFSENHGNKSSRINTVSGQTAICALFAHPSEISQYMEISFSSINPLIKKPNKKSVPENRPVSHPTPLEGWDQKSFQCHTQKAKLYSHNGHMHPCICDTAAQQGQLHHTSPPRLGRGHFSWKPITAHILKVKGRTLSWHKLRSLH